MQKEHIHASIMLWPQITSSKLFYHEHSQQNKNSTYFGKLIKFWAPRNSWKSNTGSLVIWCFCCKIFPQMCRW